MRKNLNPAFVLSLTILLAGASGCGGDSTASRIESESTNREQTSIANPGEIQSNKGAQASNLPTIHATKDEEHTTVVRTPAPVIHATKDEEHISVVRTPVPVIHATKDEEHISVVRTPAPVIHATKDEEHISVVRTPAPVIHATKDEEHISVVRTPAPVIHATKDEEHISVVRTPAPEIHATKDEEHISVVRTPAPVIHATKDEEHTSVVLVHTTKDEEHISVVVDKKHPSSGKRHLLSFDNRDWGAVTGKKRSEKGSYGVIVLSADDGSSLAVKDHRSIYSSFIANELLKSAHFSIAENILVKKEKSEGPLIQNAIDGTSDLSKNKKARTTPSVPHFQVQEWIFGGHITDEKNLGRLSSHDAEEIGRIYIYDQLLQYRDRIWINKNLRANPTNTGNMLYDQSKKRITFIDNGIGLPDIRDAKKKEKYIEEGVRSIHDLVASVNDPKFASVIASQLKSENGEMVHVSSEDIQIGLKKGIEELQHLGSVGVRNAFEKAIRTLEETDVSAEDLERVMSQKEIISELMVGFK
ncbi:MAG: hypothetical protein HYX41_01920 [Bdellovibrio sp.]|nr:hypothetical protein [Bdellovibrio sp.]